MADFKPFASAVDAQYKAMLKADTQKRNMFLIDATGDELWAHYLASFPEGTNPMFRERTEHDCSCCRNFIKNIAGVVFLKDGKLSTVWDKVSGCEEYDVVAAKMAEFVRSKQIFGPFVAQMTIYGAAQTKHNGETWNHFHAQVPREYIAKNLHSNVVGLRRDDVAILKRSLEEITDDSVEIVSELIAQKSLYRGEEHKSTIKALLDLKKKYNKLSGEQKVFFLWETATPATRIRNTVIGTLLTDLSEGVDLEAAVKSFEAKVAPANYKRPKALVTQKMIDQAKKTVEELGIEDSLYRRYAVKTDISVNNVLFADNSVKPLMVGGVFDNIKPTAQKAAVDFKNVETVEVSRFLSDVLPKATEVELFVENKLFGNFVSLVAPVHIDSKPLFKWDNGFSWSYDGEVTDSIKERVKKAGGKVDGDIRISLSWHNKDDLDLGVVKGGEKLYFGHKRAFGAHLDVDTNGGGTHNYVDPVENIVWAKRSDLKKGVYKIYVNQWSKRTSDNQGFEVEVEIMGDIYTYSARDNMPSGKTIEIGTLTVNGATGDVIVGGGLKKGGSSREKWGIKSGDFVPVEMIMRSPNFWDDKKIGNQHVFFMLKGCKNPESTRGFYNEFLRDDLTEHRKVFEMLAGVLKTPVSDDQLSGVGVSTTQKTSVIVRVSGATKRLINVSF